MIRFVPALLLAALAPAVPLSPPARAAAPPTKAKPTKVEGKPEDVFVTTKVHTIHLTVSAKAFEQMQPTRGAFVGPPMGKQPAPKKDDDDVERKAHGGFGFDFAWVKGKVEIDGSTFEDVAIRYKGSGTYATAGQSAKKPFKIDLDRFVDGQSFMGVRNLTLNNHAMDPTAAREAMSYAVYRAAGVPAPRTAYAEVSITVPGKYDKEFLGLYTLVEPIDKPFLEKHFRSKKGLLIKPEQVGVLEYLGEDWKPYEARYRPKTDATKEAQKRLIDFVRLVQKEDKASFDKKISSYLDVDEFLRFLACTVLLASMDSFIGLNHNWMAYLNPKTDKWVVMPWDLDLSYGAFVFVGTPEQLMDLSIRQPYPGDHKLISRLFEDEKVYDAYKGHLQKLLKSGFTADAAKKDLAAIRKVIDPILEREKKAAAARQENRGGMVAMFANAPAIDTFVTKRIESVQAQLDGKSKGTVLRGGFGGPRPPANPAAGLVRPAMQEADKDRDGKLTKKEAVAALEALFALCEADKKGEVEQAELTRVLDKIVPKPKGFGNVASPAPIIARRMLEKAGKNGKLSRTGLVAAADKLFDREDRNKDGKLDESELGEALREVMPLPNPGGIAGFNPMNAVVRPSLEAADKDVDGKLTRAEAVAAVKALFALCEADKKGEVEQAALTKVLDKVMPKQGGGGFAPPSQAPAIARRIVERAGKQGKVTQDSLITETERTFALADRDRNGVLDEVELGEAMRGLVVMPDFGGQGGFNPAFPIVRPALEATDKDVDGRLSKAEVTAGVKALFALCEADKKGEVDQAALGKALEKIVPKQQGFNFMPQPAALAKSIVEKAGKDGKLTEARLIAEAEKRFAAADKDKDGKLDEVEMAEALRDVVPAPQFGPPKQ